MAPTSWAHFESRSYWNVFGSLCIIKPWKKGECQGQSTYLCDKDLKSLDEEIRERASICKALDTVEVCDEAAKLKASRIQNGVKFLLLLRCPKLAQFLETKDINPPSRPWVNDLIKRIEVHLAHVTFVDNKRFLACSYHVIDVFFNEFSSLIRNTLEELRFNADETMFELTRRTKFVIPDSMKVYVEPSPPEFPHITAMCCTNIIGIKPPVLIILSNLKNLPEELKQFVNTGQIWVFSTSSGWMNRWAFTAWAFFFVIWYSNWISNHTETYRDQKGLLILDGHTSRESPLALQIFNTWNINVLVLPSHTTHVLQLFDVGLAGALKEKFTNNFFRYMKEKEYYVPGNNSATMRKMSITAFVDAWDAVCNRSNCASTAATVGLQPVDREAPKRNPYVRDLTMEENEIFNQRMARRQGRLDINNFEITKIEKIQEIKECVSKNAKDAGLCVDISQFHNAQELYSYIVKNAGENGVNVLCKPQQYCGVNFV